ncbi:MAG TPA: amylo-alpha-1,6-glucosidase [Pyrinomonadaceae bacterium]|nr:amylo-alpha-1,6-glucosidase [Pyrinomonadaceae bacterium]
MIAFDSTICGDFQAATSREWLETNGIGGFAFATISGANTRRYHGILTAAVDPPLGRVTLVSKIEETLTIDDVPYELSSNQYPVRVHPQGFAYLKSFRLDPFPMWTYEIDGIELAKTIFMVHGQNTTVCRWKIRRPNSRDTRNVTLEVRPLLSFVDYHQLSKERGEFDRSFEEELGIVRMRPVESLPEIFFHHSANEIRRTGYWYHDFEYAIERERGFDFREDLFQPFAMRFDEARTASLIVSSEEPKRPDASRLEKTEMRRRSNLVKRSGAVDEFTSQLVRAADQFVVARGRGHTIIAGYPWFSDWGRDTMISLNGLTLATQRPEIARGILLEYSRHISQGMIPNRFPDAGDQAEYNTVDATLWFFEAIRAYVHATGDHGFVRDQLYEKLADIFVWHLRGTRYNIHIDTDGLLYAGEQGTQLTWMDAKIGDNVITPRIGKPVEIQALWYNALRIMADFAGLFGDLEDQARYLAMADLTKLSFNALFWNDIEQCLYDVIDGGQPDASIRPNQIFAVSLNHSMLDAERSKKIVDKVEAELLTPVGLRSLSPRDESYVPIYIGSPLERDSAYHQGTVWGWLIGPFVDAYRRAYPERSDRVNEIADGFRKHLTEAGVGQISEIFDAEAPHTPRGCPAQAWSVAEVLRVISENTGRRA